MARRQNKDTLFNDLIEIFMHVPAWFCIPAAVVGYFAVIIGFSLITNPVLKGLAAGSEGWARIVAGIILFAGFLAAINKWHRRGLYDKQTGIESIRSLSWSQFELLIGEAYRRQGYQVTENGGGGADGGIDLVLSRGGERKIVQCKQWKVYKVGVKPVRELYGVLMAGRADAAVFVTSGVYTKEARDFAVGKPMELIDGKALCGLVKPVAAQRSEQNLDVCTEESSASDIACPRCGGKLQKKVAKRGRNVGGLFFGCSNFPDCRFTRNL